MSEGALLFWPLAFAAVAVGTVTFVSGMVICGIGAMRHSRRSALLGAFIATAGFLAAIPPLHMWLDQFHGWRIPPFIVRYGWPFGFVAAVVLLTAFFKSPTEKIEQSEVDTPRCRKSLTRRESQRRDL